MTQEEKAKAYDEAIERARIWQNHLYETDDRDYADELNYIFPELAESEDERIRKEIIDFVKSRGGFKGDWIAWLEKQVENNPYSGVSFKYNGHTWGMCARDNGVDILLDKQLFKHLEKQGEQKSIWHNEDEEPKIGSLILLIMQSGTPIVAKIIEPNHTFNHGERWAYIDDLLEEQDEQKSYASETMNEKEDFDSSFTRMIEKEQKSTITPKFKVGDIIRHKEQGITCKITAIDTATAQYEVSECSGTHLPFDFQDAWELVEQKPAEWSEEDEKISSAIIKRLSGSDALSVGLQSAICWVENVKDRVQPQNTWKPSDEQMNALKHAFNDCSIAFADMKILATLYEQLKALHRYEQDT